MKSQAFPWLTGSSWIDLSQRLIYQSYHPNQARQDGSHAVSLLTSVSLHQLQVWLGELWFTLGLCKAFHSEMFRTWIEKPHCLLLGKSDSEHKKSHVFLTRKFGFVLYSIKRKQTQRIMEALPSNPFYPESSSEIKWAVRSCCDFHRRTLGWCFPRQAWHEPSGAAAAQALGQSLLGVSRFPSPIFLLPLPCSPFSRVLLTVQLSSLCCCGLFSSALARCLRG